MARAVRDSRYKYIRNYRPEKPYVMWMAYPNIMPTMQEIFRLHAAAKLDEVQSMWMADSRPVHELYDTESDVHEVNNLAYDPDYRDVLTRMQKALDTWIQASNDWGFASELDMVEAMWPGGTQPQTGAPVMLPRASTSTAILPGTMNYQASGGTFDSPVEIMMYSPTQGASITYAVVGPEGNPGPWLLYSSPLTLSQSTRLQAKAIRYGYQVSPTIEASFQITASQ